ncbi:MAG: acyl carrier protein [Actinobacteria bacterium ATB1]|nr:acyl carrier protein [Actinobacteria bacterium ATB1]
MERSEILETVRKLAVDTLEVAPEAVVETASFADDLDADSLDLVELVMAMEDEFGVSIPEEELEGIETVAQVIDLVQAKQS